MLELTELLTEIGKASSVVTHKALPMFIELIKIDITVKAVTQNGILPLPESFYSGDGGIQVRIEQLYHTLQIGRNAMVGWPNLIKSSTHDGVKIMKRIISNNVGKEADIMNLRIKEILEGYESIHNNLGLVGSTAAGVADIIFNKHLFPEDDQVQSLPLPQSNPEYYTSTPEPELLSLPSKNPEQED
tara:strand:- start:181 stop:741 length:561 start_codon:yes stop_codon:yes gene_type:complete